MEITEQSKMVWAPDPRCSICGERMARCQRSEHLPTMHDDCYAIADMPRFLEAPRTNLGRKITGFEKHFDEDGRYKYHTIREE